jgi:pyruvate dehydrogenase E1 component alpha subunit
VSKKPTATAEKKPAVAAPANDHAKAPINAGLSREEKIELHRKMVRIRRFEERSLRAYQSKKIGGFLHLYIGQEAVAVGCCSLMGKNDHVITAYRDHGHAMAVGMDTKPLMAELYGKATGCSRAKAARCIISILHVIFGAAMESSVDKFRLGLVSATGSNTKA